MPTHPGHPLENTGPYFPPNIVDSPRRETRGIHPTDPSLKPADQFTSLVATLMQLYPARFPGPFASEREMRDYIGKGSWPPTELIGRIWRNNQPVADKQTLTMNTAGHPFGSNVGPYIPPSILSTHAGPRGKPIEAPISKEDWNYTERVAPNLAAILSQLYPHDLARGGSPNIANSQAIGDRSPTTMTNPLSAYHPLTMSNTPLNHQLATMITQHLAGHPTPLVNTPLAGAATQMGSALAARLKG